MGKRGPKPTARKFAVLSTQVTPDLRSALEKAAKANGHTLSKEIAIRLWAGLSRPDAVAIAEIRELASRLADIV